MGEVDTSKESLKKYRAYLTRLTKALAPFEVNNHQQVSATLMREALVGRGELRSFLDDGWEKRAFKDTGLFTSMGNGFFEVDAEAIEDAKKEKRFARMQKRDIEVPVWEGIRPTEDVVGDSLQRSVRGLHRAYEVDVREPYYVRIRSEKWLPWSESIVRAMDYAKSRGLKKPLVPMAERSLAEHDGFGVSETVIAVWLVDSVKLIEDFASLSRYLKKPEAGHSVRLQVYHPLEFPVVEEVEEDDEGNPKKVARCKDVEVTPEVALRQIRRILVSRRLMPRRKR